MTVTASRVRANGIEIAYQTFGNPADSPIVLVMGLGMQMIGWPDGFCHELTGRGHYVVRFDNRDVGESTHMSEAPPPDIVGVALHRRPPAYRISDMADDLVGLLGALGLESVHLVGASLGGFISQTVAIRHPQRVRSLTLMMTSTGSRRVGQAKPKLIKRMLRRRVVADRHAAVEAIVDTFELIGSQGYALDREFLRDLAGRSFDRGHNPDGVIRQLGAASVQPNRTKALARIKVPTLVIHGLHDPLIAVSGGLAIAAAIPGAKFVGYSGMGHDLPRPLFPEFTNEIHSLVERADSQTASADP